MNVLTDSRSRDSRSARNRRRQRAPRRLRRDAFGAPSSSARAPTRVRRASTAKPPRTRSARRRGKNVATDAASLGVFVVFVFAIPSRRARVRRDATTKSRSVLVHGECGGGTVGASRAAHARLCVRRVRRVPAVAAALPSAPTASRWWMTSASLCSESSVNPAAPPRGVPALSTFPAASAAASTARSDVDSPDLVARDAHRVQRGGDASTASSNSARTPPRRVWRRRGARALIATGNAPGSDKRASVPADRRAVILDSRGSFAGSFVWVVSVSYRIVARSRNVAARANAADGGGHRERTMATLFARTNDRNAAAPRAARVSASSAPRKFRDGSARASASCVGAFSSPRVSATVNANVNGELVALCGDHPRRAGVGVVVPARRRRRPLRRTVVFRSPPRSGLGAANAFPSDASRAGPRCIPARESHRNELVGEYRRRAGPPRGARGRHLIPKNSGGGARGEERHRRANGGGGGGGGARRPNGPPGGGGGGGGGGAP